MQEVQRSNKKKRAGIGRRGLENQAQREYISHRPEVQALTAVCPPEIAFFFVEEGLKDRGHGLDSFLFQNGPMLDFCDKIAAFNQSDKRRVKESKMKLLKTWPNHRNELYICNGALKYSNITLTPEGKHHLLLHVDLDQDGMSHKLESICRSRASDVITLLHDVSRKLPEYVDKAEKNKRIKKEKHEKMKEQFRIQAQMICAQENCSKAVAEGQVRGATRYLYGGFLPKVSPETEHLRHDIVAQGGTRRHKKGKTFTGTDMVLIANPGKTKKAFVERRSVVEHANAPVLNALEMQRCAVSYKMNKYGLNYMTAHKEVGESDGINLKKLFGLERLEKTDPAKAVEELAALCFNKVRGYEYFGEQQNAGGDA